MRDLGWAPRLLPAVRSRSRGRSIKYQLSYHFDVAHRRADSVLTIIHIIHTNSCTAVQCAPCTQAGIPDCPWPGHKQQGKPIELSFRSPRACPWWAQTAGKTNRALSSPLPIATSTTHLPFTPEARVACVWGRGAPAGTLYTQRVAAAPIRVAVGVASGGGGRQPAGQGEGEALCRDRKKLRLPCLLSL